MAFAPKPAIEKLPLAVRKDLKDNYDTQKGELETKIAALLGVESFHSNLNPNHIWAYNTDDRSSAGGTLYRYLEGFHDAVKYYVDKYGETGKEHFNDAVSQREVVAVVNELGDKASYIDADIKDGVFRILFRWDSLGSNSSYLTDYLLKAVDSVPREGLGVAAKWSVDQYWEPRKAELTQQLEEITGLTGLQLEPNFDQLYKELTVVEEDDRWRDSLGEGVYNYFNDGLKYQLERQGFKGDEMMHEGIAEVATAKKFGLRVVKETKKKGAYNEIVIEDGEIWIQFTPQNWRTNVGDAGAGLIDLL